MAENQIFIDKFYSERENLVNEYIRTQLDKLQERLKQLYLPCMTRVMNAQIKAKSDKAMTIRGLLNLEPSQRQMVVRAAMYNDAL